jgi:hypothetical protein
VQLVNDTHETATGRLSLTWELEPGGLPVQAATRFTVAPVRTAVCELELAAPSRAGHYLLVARAFWDGKPWSPTISRRKVLIEAANAGR